MTEETNLGAGMSWSCTHAANVLGGKHRFQRRTLPDHVSIMSSSPNYGCSSTDQKVMSDDLGTEPTSSEVQVHGHLWASLGIFVLKILLEPRQSAQCHFVGITKSTVTVFQNSSVLERFRSSSSFYSAP